MAIKKTRKKTAKKVIQMGRSSRLTSTSGWPYLQPGDTVDIIAPASAANEAFLKKATEILKSWGLNVHVPDNLLDPKLFLANTDQVRFQHLKNALLNSKSKAVWCLRGGYGSIRLLPELAKLKTPKQKKIFIGISDVVTIHLYLNQFWKWPSLHGALIDRLGSGLLTEDEMEEMKQLLFGIKTELVYPIRPLNGVAKKLLDSQSWQKKINSSQKKIIGGNLVTFESSVGTAFFKPTTEFIFFEELAERAYRIDRIFHHLQYQNVFDSCAGIFLGTFTKCNEPDGKEIWFETIENWARDKKFPVFYGLPCGHHEGQKPLFLNTPVEFKNNQILIRN